MNAIPTLLMIRPVRFTYNEQTAVNNMFQTNPEFEHHADQVDTQSKAKEEFDAFVEKLRAVKIAVLVIEDTREPHTPDAVFPNNWITTHEDGTVVLYPMFALNRRLERKDAVLDVLKSSFKICKSLDLTHYEAQNKFLEGTGSFVLDRAHRIAYACLSPRTDEEVLEDFCKQLGYTPIVFHAFDKHGIPIYHTNVMMCVADQYVVINLESVPKEERERIVESINETGKEIIPITSEQMEQFAGNMLQVFNRDGNPYLVMSTQAHKSLTDAQLTKLTSYNPIIHSDLGTIEKNGGGSARCMLAEIYLETR